MQFSMWGEVLVTYNDEDAYLFAHPATTGQRATKGAADRHTAPRELQQGRWGARQGRVGDGPRRRRARVDSSEEESSDDEGEGGVPVACFRGQRNSQTIKGISFFGYVCM